MNPYKDRAAEMLRLLAGNVIKTGTNGHAQAIQKLQHDLARLQAIEENGVKTVEDVVAIQHLLKWLSTEIATISDDLGKAVDRHKYMSDAGKFMLVTE
jgi:hypothetical protein